jgi:hypothetical protein
VSPAGNDTNAGTRDAPFATIARASAALAPGGTCVIHAGVYRETIRPAVSGTPDKPIVYRAAGDGRVVVTGADPVSGWIVHDEARGIYKAPLAAGGDLGAWKNQVLVDGQAMMEARFPNAAYDPETGFDQILLDPGAWMPIPTPKNSDRLRVPLSALGDNEPSDYWKGTRILAVASPAWTANSGLVTASKPGRLTISKDGGAWVCDPQRDTGMQSIAYLTGVLNALDAPGEWYIGEGFLFLIMPSGKAPGKELVEVKRREWAADLDERDHIVLDGILFRSGTARISGSHNVVENCTFRYLSWDEPRPYRSDGGLIVSGSRNTIRNVLIDGTAYSGISLGGSYNTVENCIIRNVNIQAGYGAGVMLRAVRDGKAIPGNHNTVTHTTIYNSGRYAIGLYGKTDTVEYNRMWKTGLLTADAAAMYSFGHDSEQTTVRNNWIHDNREIDTVSAGIYLDNGAVNFIVHHNVIWNCAQGIFINPRFAHQPDVPPANQIFNNTLLVPPGKWPVAIQASGAQCESRFVNNLYHGGILNISTYPPPAAEIGHNGVFPIGPDFVPIAGSAAIDAGMAIAGITDGFHGSAPDIGAYEFGVAPWTAGHTGAPGIPDTGTCAPPVLAPIGRVYSEPLPVSLSSATPGAVVRYTTDGSDPTAASPAYAAPLDIVATTTIKARAFKAGWDRSEQVSATYTVTKMCETPSFAPDPQGIYRPGQAVGVSCFTPGTVVRYTTDGSDPTAASPVVTGSIDIAETTAFKARAFKPGLADSGVAAATVVILKPTDTLVTFDDRTNGPLIQAYGGIVWPNEEKYWGVADGPGHYNAMFLYPVGDTTTEQTRTFELPAGAVLKHLSLRSWPADGEKNRVQVSSDGNPTRTWTEIDGSWTRHSTGWKQPSAKVTVKIWSSAGNWVRMGIDDIVYGNP